MIQWSLEVQHFPPQNHWTFDAEFPCRKKEIMKRCGWNNVTNKTMSNEKYSQVGENQTASVIYVFAALGQKTTQLDCSPTKYLHIQLTMKAINTTWWRGCEDHQKVIFLNHTFLFLLGVPSSHMHLLAISPRFESQPISKLSFWCFTHKEIHQCVSSFRWTWNRHPIHWPLPDLGQADWAVSQGPPHNCYQKRVVLSALWLI